MPDRFRNLGTIWASAGLDYSSFDQGVQHIDREVVNLDRRMTQQIDQMGKRWDSLGRRMSVGVTLPLTVIATQATRTFADFEKSMARTAAVAQATDAEWAAMTRTARELGATTRYTASEAAEGMTFLAMAGFEANRVIEAMPGVLQLAASAHLDLATAADITTNILTGYGLAVEELGRVNDVLVSTMTGANTNLQQLGEAMKYAGPVASAAGVAFEEAAAAIALMGNAGIQGSMAGTSLRGALTRLLNPTGQVRDVIQKLGLDLYDTNGNLVSMIEIVAQLERSGATAGDMMILFGQRAGPAMQALVDQGSQALAKFNERLLDSEGVAARIATMQEDTFAGSLLVLRSAWEELSMTVAETWIPTARTVIDGLSSLVRWFANLPEPVHRGAVAFGAVLAVVGPLTIAIRTLHTALVPMAGPLGIILAVAGAVGALAAATSQAEVDMASYIDEVIQSSRSMQHQIDQLDDLINRYDALHGKPNLSAEEHDELRKIIDQIVTLAPQAVVGYDEMGRALIGNAEYARKFREELSETLRQTLEITAREAEVRLPFLRSELERLLDDLHATNDAARAERELLERLQAEGTDSFFVEAARRRFASAQEQAARTAEQVRNLYEEISRLETAQEKLKLFMRGDLDADPPIETATDSVENYVNELKRSLQEEVRTWELRAQAAGQGTAEQRRVFEDFLTWLDGKLDEVPKDPLLGVFGLDADNLEAMATLRTMRDGVQQIVEEMKALDEVARIRAFDPPWDRGIREAHHATIEDLKRQREEVEMLLRSAERLGYRGEQAARIYQQALRDIEQERLSIERMLDQARRDAADEIEQARRAAEERRREDERRNEAELRHLESRLRLQIRIREVMGDPIDLSEQVQMFQDLRNQVDETFARRALGIKLRFDYALDRMVEEQVFAPIGREFAQSFAQQLDDEIALLEARINRLPPPPTAELVLPDDVAGDILSRYEEGLNQVAARLQVVGDHTKAFRDEANLIEQTLVAWIAAGLDPFDERIEGLEERLRFLRIILDDPFPTPEEPGESFDISGRLQEMEEALEKARAKASVFGEGFDLAGESVKIIRGTIEDLLSVLGPTDETIQRLMERMAAWSQTTNAVSEVQAQLDAELAENMMKAWALGAAFDQNQADAQAYGRALERLATISLSLTNEELAESLELMAEWGDKIRELTTGETDLSDVIERLGASLLRTATGAQTLGSFLNELWQNAEDQGISMVQSFSQAAQGVMANAGNIVTTIIDEILGVFRVVSQAQQRLRQQSERDREQRQTDEQRFNELITAGFRGTFETTTRTYQEQVSILFGLFHRTVTHTQEITAEETEAWIERMSELLRQFQQVGQHALREAFSGTPDETMPNFLTSLNQGIYDSVLDGLVTAFSEHQIYQRAMAPLFQAMDEAINDAFSGASFDEDAFWRRFRPALEQFERDMEGFEGPAAAMRRVLDELRGDLGLPDPAQSSQASGGTRLTALTGESREALGEWLRPVGVLDFAPVWHDQHMARLDTIISIMRDGSMAGGLEHYLEIQAATLHSETVMVQLVQSATFTGPITGTVNVTADGEDVSEFVGDLLDGQGGRSDLASRGAGLD